jgi:peroxiredoxin
MHLLSLGSFGCPFLFEYRVKLHVRKEANVMKLYVGQAAPDFNLPSHLDKDIKLSDYLGKNVVLVFFPLAWTPV